MTSKHGVHAKSQVNIRFPPDVLARLKADADRHGQPQSDIVVRGTVAELDRLDGIAARSGAPLAVAEDGQPQRPAHRPNCKCAVCRPE